jgi:predicted PurR-regulated permease PerM
MMPLVLQVAGHQDCAAIVCFLHPKTAGMGSGKNGIQSSRTTLVTFLILLLFFLVVTVRIVSPYLLAVTMGGIVALLSHPLYRRLRQRKLRPKPASILVTLAVFVLVIGPLSLFATLAVRQGINIAQALADNNDLSYRGLMGRISHWPFMQTIIGDAASVERSVRNALQGLGKGATALVLGVAASVPNLLLQLVLTLISCFFLLMDGPRFLSWAADKIPLDSDVRSKLAMSFKDTTISVIWATFAAAAVQASVILAGFLALGIPAAFLAAAATFVFAWIPMIGSAPVWITGVLYLYLQGEIGKCIAMVGVGLFTGIIDNFVRPLVLKGRGGMHPLVSLVSIFGGIQVFGIFGVFLGPILAAILISLLQIWPAVAERFGLFTR